jgi:hypothetical protein
MRLDIDPFLANTIGCGKRKILVRIDHADTTRGKNVIVLDDLRNWMIKPRSPEVGVWKNTLMRPGKAVVGVSRRMADQVGERAGGVGPRCG